MARRTKEDAALTRSRLLDAAQAVFSEKGVAGASLTDVALAASLSRGAIYWHFKGKADLFDAMMQRVTLPFEQAWEQQLAFGSDGMAVLKGVTTVLQMVLRSVSQDAMTQCVLDIAWHKTECVGEMQAVRERRMLGERRFTQEMEVVLELAAQQANLMLPMPAICAARGLHAVFNGLLQSWLLHDDCPFDLEREGMQAVSAYLNGLGFRCQKEITQIAEEG